MVNLALVRHIDKEKSKGVSQSELIKHLKHWKYSDLEIKDAFDYISFRDKHSLKEEFNFVEENKKLITSISVVFFLALFVSLFVFFILNGDTEIDVEKLSTPASEVIDQTTKTFHLSSTGTVLYINKGQDAKFEYATEDHTITLINIGLNFAELIIKSEPKHLIVYLNQENMVDLDGNDIPDISITLKSTTRTQVVLLVKFIERKSPSLKEDECLNDSDCDDDLINTEDRCVTKKGVKVCENVISSLCDVDEDCKVLTNQTAYCVHDKDLSYCQYYPSDKCLNDEDCEDYNETTKDHCLIINHSTNYCVYENINYINCGDFQLNNNSLIYEGDDGTGVYNESFNTVVDKGNLSCIEKWGLLDVDFDIKIMDDSNVVEFGLIHNDKGIQINFYFDELKLNSQDYSTQDMVCKYDVDSINDVFEIEGVEKGGSNNIIRLYNHYISLLSKPYLLRKYCEGTIFEWIDPVPEWMEGLQTCNINESCWDKNLRVCNESVYTTYSEDGSDKIIYLIDGFSGDNCVLNKTFLKNEFSGTSFECKLPVDLVTKGWVLTNAWINDNIDMCNGSYIILNKMLSDLRNCTNDMVCSLLYEQNGRVIPLNSKYLSDYINYYEKQGTTFVVKPSNGIKYYPLCNRITKECSYRVIR